MEWLASERRTVEPEGNPWVLLLESGKRPTGGDIANRWSKLLDRVQKDHANFRRLPFKYLRKTAYQLVLEVSGSHEVAGTFQGRGQLASDEHADVYGRRLFGRVFEANNLVRDRLAPTLQAAPDAFTVSRSIGSPNISRGKIDHIRQLAGQGVKATEIAQVVKVSRSTVYRWMKDKSTI